jgi:putative ABC transport system ATP-binding protein
MTQTQPASPNAGAAVRLTDVTKTFPLGPGQRLTAVDHFSLTVEPAGVLAITGPSGSGKSTLLHLVGAIERPDHGLIEIDGRALGDLSRAQLADYRRRTGFVFQRYNLLPALTALDNVLAPVLPYRTSFDKIRRAGELLGRVGLVGRGPALPSQLSGGEQQRVAIARALINSPRLLLADEPKGNLDSVSGARILELLLRLRDEHGMTVIIATHDPQIAASAGRIVRLRDGQITEEIHVRSALAPQSVVDRITRLGPSS